MSRLQEVRNRMQPILEKTLSDYLLNCEATGSRGCSAMTRYHFETGGKRLRGVIPSAVFECFKRDPKEILYFGAAVEMIHNATLVHDDLQDGDELRRGRPTVWKKYSVPQAINCGDAMFQYANELICKLSLDSSVILQLLKRSTQATIRVIEGQAQEFIMKDELEPSVARYTEIIRGKTSGLFALPVAGALEALAVAPSIVDAFEKAAMDMGMLFQIQDDLLDIYGQKGRDRVGTDIAEGKVSMLVAAVYDSGDAKAKRELSAILKKSRQDTSDTDISNVIALFESHGAKSKALATIRDLQTQIKDQAELRRLPEVHELMLELCDTFLEPLNGAF